MGIQERLIDEIVNEDITLVEEFLDAGAGANAFDRYERTPLYTACCYPENEANIAIIKRLLDRGAQIDVSNFNGKFTPLHMACNNNNEIVARLLLERGANVHLTNFVKETPLYAAVCQHGGNTIVKMLLEEGAQVNVQNEHKSTPLHNAARYGSNTVVKMLLNRGANLHAQDKNKRTPLHDAVCMQNAQALRALLERGAYSYQHTNEPAILISESFKEYVARGPAGTACGIALLLGGIRFDSDALPTPLKEPQSRIHEMMQIWLSPLGLSSTACENSTPHILRALPRMIHCFEAIKKFKQAQKKEVKNDSSAIKNNHNLAQFGLNVEALVRLTQSLYNKLLEKLFVKDKGNLATFGLSVEALVRLPHAVYNELLEKKLPVELIDIIEKDVSDMIVTEKLLELYPMQRDIMNYLWQNCQKYFEEYKPFHTEIFDHNWEADIPVPAMPHVFHHIQQHNLTKR